MALGNGMPVTTVVFLYGPGVMVSCLLGYSGELGGLALVAIACLTLFNGFTISHSIPGAPTLIAVYAFMSLFVLAKSVQVVHRKVHYMALPWTARLCQLPGWYVISSGHDTKVVACPIGTFDRAVAWELLMWACVAGASSTVSKYLPVLILPSNGGIVFGALPWAHAALSGGLVGCGLHILDAQYRLLWKAFGISLPSMMISPIESASLREFWGQRFDRMVADILVDVVYKPARRRQCPRAIASFAVFFASGFLHGYPVLLGCGSLYDAFAVGAFFMLQPVLLLVEEQIRIDMWPRPLRTLWLVLCLVLPAPLAVQPFSKLGQDLGLDECGPTGSAGMLLTLATAGAALMHVGSSI